MSKPAPEANLRSENGYSPELDEGDKAVLPARAKGEPPSKTVAPDVVELQTRPILQDQTNLLPMRQLLLVFAGLSSAMFCSTLNQTIVSTALPTLGRVFNDATLATWVGTAYLLTSTACQPLYGRLSDIYGRKLILLGSLLLFLIGTAISGAAIDLPMLITARAIGGIGGGGIITMVNIVISDVVSLQDRGKYQGITGGVIAVASALGPLLGGIFTQKVSWRWCFYINLPLTVGSIGIVSFGLPFRRVEGNHLQKLKQIDGIGCILSVIATTLILIAVSWAGSTYAWSSVAVIAPLVLGAALIVVFIVFEWKFAKLPLIPMHIFKNAHVSTCIFTSFLTGFCNFVNLYYLPQFYQVAKGDSAFQSGVLILPLILSQIVTSFSSGYLVSRFGCYRIQLILGYALWTVASGLFTTVTPKTSNGLLVFYQLLTGLGCGQTTQITLVAIQAAVKRNEMAVTTGARNYLRLLGCTLAVAATGTIINNVVKRKLESLDFSTPSISSIVADPSSITSLGLSAAQQSEAIAAYAHGVQVVYYMMIALTAVQFWLCVIFVKDYSLKREDDEKQKAEAKARLAEKKRRARAEEKV